jgi:hypothetical protein
VVASSILVFMLNTLEFARLTHNLEHELLLDISTKLCHCWPRFMTRPVMSLNSLIKLGEFKFGAGAVSGAKD